MKFIALFFMCISSMMLQGQSYDKLWERVEQAQRSGLPQTAIKYTDQIFRKAEKEKNSGQMLKAYTARSQYVQSLTPDSFYVDLKKMEVWAESTAIPADAAVLHTLIAQIYSNYAQRNMYQLLHRGDVIDTPAEDISEWSKGMFVEKILGHTRKALKDPALLFNLSSKQYIPFVKQQSSSRYFNHNMYHLLASYGISSLKGVRRLVVASDSIIVSSISDIYSGLNEMYRQQNNSDALVLLALERLGWRKSDNGISYETYLSMIDQLIEKYGDRPVCAELYLSKAQELNMREKKVEALHVCREAVAKYPKYDRLNALKQVENEILKPYLHVSIPVEIYPGDSVPLQVSHTNLNGFSVHIYTVNIKEDSPLLYDHSDTKELEKTAVKIASHHIPLVRPEDYLATETTCSFIAPVEGLFLVEIVPDQAIVKSDSKILSVTRIKLLSRMLPENRFEIAVLDAKNGDPIADATVNLFVVNKGDNELNRSVKSNDEGRAELDWNDRYRYLSAEKGNSKTYFQQRIWRSYYDFSDKQTERLNVTLLTDRALYRPGQTVYIKGVAFNQLSDTANVAAEREFTVSLMDANNREVHKKTLKTNEFGSFTTEFILPSGGLNGIYTLRTTGTETHIRVEEYKRPTFEVILNNAVESYKLGDEVKLKGSAKTFSGVPMQDAQVKYEVTRSTFGWWRQAYGINDMVDSGIVELDDNGEFVVPVSLKPDKNFNSDYGYYLFSISASITNVAGETQKATTRIMAGSRSLLLSVDLPELLRKDEDINLVFNAVNLNEQPVDVRGEYKLYLFTDHKLGELAEKPAYTGTFTANVGTSLPEWKTLPSGVYKLKLSARDEQGREATYETEVVLFSLDDKRPVKKTGIWYYEINTEFDASQPADFIFGTSDKDAYILMDVFSGNKRLESRSLLLTDSVIRFTYPYKEVYGDGLNITFCYVKAGKIYTHQVNLLKKIPKKTLKLFWSSFRDKLRPGQQEEWKLEIRNPDGKRADAELLATMYDASLDQIWKRNQSLHVFYNRNIPSVFWTEYFMGNSSYYFFVLSKRFNYPVLAYDTFWMKDYAQMVAKSTSLQGALYGAVTDASVRSISSVHHTMTEESSASNVFDDQAELHEMMVPGVDAEQMLEQTPNLRTNFAETAFFYPQLRTNEHGEVVIAFTLPESLTRWNFSGYAHTKGMLTGMINGEAVASKEFMLTPNLPRFVRVGDNTAVAASVANLTGKGVSGQVEFTLFDPLTNKVIAKQKQDFSAEAGKTVGVSFLFTATDNYNLLGCRLVAQGGSFSDGEQHVLPVLSNKERVIETVAMPIRGNQTREFSLEHLFNRNSKTATDRRLTVEFSGNPAWYAIQALPSLSLPVNENAISWATAYYANTLASHIMNSQPRLKAVFDAWKQQGGTKETFLSNLQKNQDVKNILLEESPWIMEAITENEQKERIATLFDLNSIRNNNLTALNKLKELQLNSGAWTWYMGMSGSRYITNYVTQLLARLTALTGQPLDSDMIAMRSAAFNFLHREALNEYNDIRRSEKNGHKTEGVSGNALQYLYLIAISGENVPDGNKTAYNYFLNKVKEDIATQGITQKALAAVVLQKAGRATDSQAFLASLKEYLTQTDEQGMFFAFNESPYVWSGLKVPAHVSVLEAFDVAGNDQATVEEMKMWLLKQKQTQQWNSPVSTANAVYALLYRGTNPTESQGDVRITWDGKVIEIPDASTSIVPGLAYIKETITDKNALSKIKKVTVEKRDEGIAWGAVYAQYEEDIDKVTSFGEGLSVDKKLYVEQVDGDRKQLIPISADHPLNVGDKVVSRITIKLDRAMDFVQLKDQRAACFEPENNLSGYLRGAGTGYYVAVKDASTNFYFDALGKGVYVLEHSYRVSRTGMYESGLAVVQSAYAPEFAAHSASVKLICR